MPAQTLLQRARAFAGGPAATLAAIVPLAAAPTANATIINQASDVTAELTISAFDAETQYFGSPLNVVPGTNGTNDVSLTTSGSLGVSRPPSGGGSPIQSHLAFVNTGIIAAAAGDIFAISYDFSLTPTLFFGGDPATSDIAWSLTAILDGDAGAPQSGSALTAASGTTLDFTGSVDVATFTEDVVADFTLLFDIFWTIPPILFGFSETEGTLAVEVPASSIDLRLTAGETPLQVPEPGALSMMLAGLSGLLAAAWWRRFGRR